MIAKICAYPSVKAGFSHFNIGAVGDLNAAASVSEHVVLHDLPVAAETDAVAGVFVDSVTAQLRSAVLLHSDSTAAVAQNAVGGQAGQLAALQHGHAGTAVAVDEVGEHVEGLAALHVESHCWRKTGEKAVAGLFLVSHQLGYLR